MIEEKNPKEEETMCPTLPTYNPSTLIFTSTSSCLERMVKKNRAEEG